MARQKFKLIMKSLFKSYDVLPSPPQRALPPGPIEKPPAMRPRVATVAQLPPPRAVDYPHFNVSQLASSSYAVLLYNSGSHWLNAVYALLF